MTNQQLSRASSIEGFSIARQAMQDAVDFFLANGGPAVARIELTKVNEALSFYNGHNEAYCEAMARIDQAEKAEQQRAEAHKLEQQQQMMMKAVMSAIHPQHQATHPVLQECPDLPAKLSTPEAMQLWQLLQQAGLIDKYYQPVGLSRTDVALLAYEMTMRLSDENEILTGGIEWKPFEMLWNRKNLKADYQHAMKQDKTAKFTDRLKRLFTGSTYR
jgi:hypothetical protein